MVRAALFSSSILLLASCVQGGYYDKKGVATATTTSAPTNWTTTFEEIIDDVPLEHLNSGHTLLSEGHLRITSSCNSCQATAFAAPPGGCTGSNCIIYEATSQTSCVVASSQPASTNALWKAGLNLNVDQRILGGKIAAYQLRLATGAWSGWYVPGYNDLDIKINAGCGLRRRWSYFVDHVHTYIICK